MPKFFVDKNQINNDEIYIIGEDVKHIRNVLRSKIGDEIVVCDGVQTDYICTIKDISQEKVMLVILEKEQNQAEPKIHVDLYQGYPKSDKMDFIVQKCTEVGINSIIPTLMKRTIVKLDDKDKNKKVQRLQKIAEEAAKQSKRVCIPKVKEVISSKNMFENLKNYDIVLVPYECEKDSFVQNALSSLDKEKINNIAIVIGPEGGIADEEIKQMACLPNLEFISLGKRILRTETAGLVTLAVIMYEFGEMK